MKNFKTEFRFYTVTEYEKEQEYLRKRRSEGWKFVGVNLPGFYHFTKCKPEDVVYQLDYNPEGIAHQAEYIQMFEDCGWEHLLDFVGYSYFCKPVADMKEEDEAIFCDDNSRLDMARRVFKGRMIPLIIIFLCGICPQLLIQFCAGNTFSRVLFWVFVAIFGLYLMIFIQFGYFYSKYKRRKKL